MKITVSVLWLSMKSNITKNLTAFHQISFYRPVYPSILTYTLILITSLQNYTVHLLLMFIFGKTNKRYEFKE